MPAERSGVDEHAVGSSRAGHHPVSRRQRCDGRGVVPLGRAGRRNAPTLASTTASRRTLRCASMAKIAASSCCRSSDSRRGYQFNAAAGQRLFDDPVRGERLLWGCRLEDCSADGGPSCQRLPTTCAAIRFLPNRTCGACGGRLHVCSKQPTTNACIARNDWPRNGTVARLPAVATVPSIAAHRRIGPVAAPASVGPRLVPAHPSQSPSPAQARHPAISSSAKRQEGRSLAGPAFRLFARRLRAGYWCSQRPINAPLLICSTKPSGKSVSIDLRCLQTKTFFMSTYQVSG